MPKIQQLLPCLCHKPCCCSKPLHPPLLVETVNDCSRSSTEACKDKRHSGSLFSSKKQMQSMMFIASNYFYTKWTLSCGRPAFPSQTGDTIAFHLNQDRYTSCTSTWDCLLCLTDRMNKVWFLMQWDRSTISALAFKAAVVLYFVIWRVLSTDHFWHLLAFTANARGRLLFSRAGLLEGMMPEVKEFTGTTYRAPRFWTVAVIPEVPNDLGPLYYSFRIKQQAAAFLRTFLLTVQRWMWDSQEPCGISL